jgi:hypothetical protein
MGTITNEIYKMVTEKAGFKGRMRLAVKTGISRTKGAQIEDTPEMTLKPKHAADEIVGIDIDQFLVGGKQWLN